MGEPTPISLGRGSKKSKIGLEGVASFVNAYIEDHGDGSKTGFTAYCINGNEQYAELTDGEGVRAMLDLGTSLLVVAGQRLFEVGSGGTPVVDIGGIPVDGFVTMAQNQLTPDPQVVIVCDGSYFIYSGGSLSVGADADLPSPLAVVAHERYFVFIIEDGRWFIAGPNAVTVDGLLFSTAESQPDKNVMAVARGPDLIIFGTRSADFFNNTGATDFPYTKATSMNVGCYAAGSVQNIMARVNKRMVDSVIWAATDNGGAYAGVYILDGLTPVKISNAEVDRALRNESDVEGIRSQAWTEESLNGETHAFYAVSGTNFTFVFDSITGEWHGRKSAGLDRWRYACHATFMGEHIWGDYSTNKLWRSDPELLTDAGEPLTFEITIPTVHMAPRRMRVNAIWLDALTGVGAVSTVDEDANPKMLIDYTADGGASFATVRYAELGAAGQRSRRVKERAFGRFDHNGVAFRFRCSAAVAKGIQNLHIDADPLGA